MNQASMPAHRAAVVHRDTLETRVMVRVDLDGRGDARIATGVGFFDHMLHQIAHHGGIDLEITADGDLHIDAHHTVEDVGITLGQALARALGDRAGIQRFGHVYVPLDEALTRTVIDLSGRPMLVFEVPFTRERVGDFDLELVREFFQGLVNHLGATVHAHNLSGINAHHQAESLFKAFGRALRQAVAVDPKNAGAVPSTKGSL